MQNEKETKEEKYLQQLDRIANMDVSDKIGELKTDENGNHYRNVGGKEIKQIEEKIEADRRLNEAINRWRLR